ncbi:major facilitator superfamily-like protein [Aureococcus anophagefferens]|nr:major facilitator superfamily-like protein [Aureococcus anophagefferens]
MESLGCTRASLSGVFSLATCCFTAGTSLGARLFGRTSVPAAVLATSFASALGLVAASRASSLPALALAYAGVFGTASGVAFALNAKFATSPVFAGFAGLATSVIISFRALGAPILSPATRTALAAGGVEALWQLAATIVVFSCPLAGRLAAGVFCDATSPRRALIATPLLAAGALGASLLVGGVAPLVVSLGGMGLAFGVNAVAIPLETSTLFGPRGFSKAFGIIFTGWGFAGLTAPVLAGVLFDRTGGYAASVAACAASLVLAAVAAAALPRRRAAE